MATLCSTFAHGEIAQLRRSLSNRGRTTLHIADFHRLTTIAQPLNLYSQCLKWEQEIAYPRVLLYVRFITYAGVTLFEHQTAIKAIWARMLVKGWPKHTIGYDRNILHFYYASRMAFCNL